MSLVHTASSSLLPGAGRDFFSNISSDLNGIAASTTSMFSDLFGNKSMYTFLVLVRLINYCNIKKIDRIAVKKAMDVNSNL